MLGQHFIELIKTGFTSLCPRDLFGRVECKVATMAHTRFDFELKARADDKHTADGDFFWSV